MRKDWRHIEKYRVRLGAVCETHPGDDYGQFIVPFYTVVTLIVMASAGGDIMPWEHVSVHARTNYGKVNEKVRTPTWDEMCFVKAVFWEDDEAMMQLHPPKKEYVNTHPHVLHLWKPLAAEIPRPPMIAV